MASSDDDFCPPKQKKTLQRKKTEDARFCSPPKNLDEYQKPFCPENTKVNTRWAVKNFTDWQLDYNRRHAEDRCPDGILLTDSARDLALWLQKYTVSRNMQPVRP